MIGKLTENSKLTGSIANVSSTNEYEAGEGIDITNNVISNTITKTSQLINDSGFINNTLQVYSMTESRVGTWINGEPIYRKVISLDRFPTRGEYRHYAHGIDNLRWITNVTIYGYNGTDTFLQVPFVSTNDIVDFFLDFTDLIILSKLDASLYTGYAVIEYLRD